MIYTCPVCGYDQLNRPPADYSICPCCRTEFGASDCHWTHAELREDWIARGAKWGSRRILPPYLWSPVEQLRNIEYSPTASDLRSMAQAQAQGTVTIFADIYNLEPTKSTTGGSWRLTFRPSALRERTYLVTAGK